MSFCSKGTVYRLEGDVIRAVSIGCGRRDCETCWPKRVGHLRRRMEAGAPNRLITLTFAEGEYDTPEGALDSLLAAWHSLVKKQRTWFRTQLPPHRVVEADAAAVETLFANAPAPHG